MLLKLENFLRRYGNRIYPFYSLLLFSAALALVFLGREQLLNALGFLTSFQIGLVLVLCIGILLLGFPSSRLGYASFDRITQGGLLWLVGPLASAVFNAVASFVFPFFIKKRTGHTWGQAFLRAIHNVGMIMLVIMAGGWAFSTAGGTYPVSALEPGVIVPVAATILAMQLVNGLFVRLRVAMTDGRIRIPIDWFANTLEPGAAMVGLLTTVIAVNTGQTITLAYLFVLLALMLTVKLLSDSRQELEAKVRERTARIEAQNQRLEEAQIRQNELVEALDRLSREDALTELFNRRHMDQFLAQEKERIDRYGGTLSIALLDLDHFKEVNDQHSHQVGDEVLRVVAGILDHEARGPDVVARYGGEEFMIALPNTSIEGARVVLERVRSSIESHDWGDVCDGLRMTISGGVASLEEAGDLEALFRLADERLYRAKEQGRNRILCEDVSA